MTEAQAHEAIAQHFKAGWNVLHPDIPFTLKNDVFDTVDEWIRLTMVPALSEQATFGQTKRWRRSGLIGVLIFTRANQGTQRASELADDVRTVLEGQFITIATDDEPVTTLAGSSGGPQTVGPWFKLLVTFPYSFDQLRVST